MASNLKKWNINEDPKAFYVKKIGSSSENPLPLYIPVLMPLMPKVKKKTSKISISKSCFINDNSCKPTISSNVTAQTFINVPVSRKANFRFSSLTFDAKLQLESDRGDENKLIVKDELDPSVNL